MKSKFSPERLEQANQILKLYSPRARLEYSGRMYFVWEDHNGKLNRYSWTPQSRGSDYPSISDRLPFGGTCTRATAELIRWCLAKPIQPIGIWKNFVKTGGVSKVFELATEFGWPKQVPCVMCGRLVGDGVSYDCYTHKPYEPGPGCYYGEGCKATKAGAA